MKQVQIQLQCLGNEHRVQEQKTGDEDPGGYAERAPGHLVYRRDEARRGRPGEEVHGDESVDGQEPRPGEHPRDERRMPGIQRGHEGEPEPLTKGPGDVEVQKAVVIGGKRGVPALGDHEQREGERPREHEGPCHGAANQALARDSPSQRSTSAAIFPCNDSQSMRASPRSE